MIEFLYSEIDMFSQLRVFLVAESRKKRKHYLSCFLLRSHFFISADSAH